MGEEEECNMIFKVILIGDSGVGKTNILSRYIRDEFSIETKATVGVEFGCKVIKQNDAKIKVQIWDTAGHERYKSITNAYYKGSRGALIVYDISRRDTFLSIDKWIGELKNHGEADVCMILIGNKTDLQEYRQVTQEEAFKKAEQYKIAYCETSAMQAVNIQKAFTIMIDEIYKKMNQSIEDDKTPGLNHDGISLDLESNKNHSSEEKKEKGCCN